jgi:hypothetical protein
MHEAGGSPRDGGGAPQRPHTKADLRVPFLQIVLVEEDGTRRTIERDGEAWIETGSTRRLVCTLTAEERERMAAALDAAGSDTWEAGDATYARGRARLVVVTPGGMTRSLALSRLDPRSLALLALVRAATS